MGYFVATTRKKKGNIEYFIKDIFHSIIKYHAIRIPLTFSYHTNQHIFPQWKCLCLPRSLDIFGKRIWNLPFWWVWTQWSMISYSENISNHFAAFFTFNWTILNHFYIYLFCIWSICLYITRKLVGTDSIFHHSVLGFDLSFRGSISSLLTLNRHTFFNSIFLKLWTVYK